MRALALATPGREGETRDAQTEQRSGARLRNHLDRRWKQVYRVKEIFNVYKTVDSRPPEVQDRVGADGRARKIEADRADEVRPRRHAIKGVR